ncbi:MAG TPA: winged helix-turn-helix domain-containing protein [Pyrinomonadaceae bacterium]|nr:winged helix-turn-helix domain-containing protein [Pyrinomonadaceae bacterium]HMP65354.1 winged helix-turn-helix domain-containing protein [Pyrinomonadaceae bacterium]
MTDLLEHPVAFGDFSLDPVRRVLYRFKEPVDLSPRAFDLLLALVTNAGRTMTKDELLELVWEGQFVEENNLTVQISALRKVFGETRSENRYIATVPGRGYKFVADILAEHVELTDLRTSFGLDKLSIEDTIIGRRSEIERLAALLLSGGHKLVTLTGAGGSGKTRLATATAEAIGKNFKDGWSFVDLSSLAEPDHVPSAIAAKIGITAAKDKERTEKLATYFTDRQFLLVLDNFEQLLPAKELVRKLGESSSSLMILVTSRVRLGLPGEIEFRVSPLAVPSAGLTPTLENLEHFPAAVLFNQRARSANPGFAVTEENACAIAEICRKLDGIPLAIELAAARIRLLSPQAINDRLAIKLKLLTGGSGERPDRHQTMRAAIEWGYELLDETEQEVFRCLSVFAGGFTIEDAEAVIGEERESKYNSSVLDVIQSLLDKNLLVHVEQKDGNARIKYLEVVREFCIAELKRIEVLDEFRRSHAVHFLALAQVNEPHLRGPESASWYDRLYAEIDNFRAALRWSLENDIETAAQIVSHIRDVYSIKNLPGEAKKLFEEVLARGDSLSSELRARVAYGLARNALILGDLDMAEDIYIDGLDSARAANNKRNEFVALHGLAAVAKRRGDLEKAEPFQQDELRVARELGDDFSIAIAFVAYSDLEIAKGQMRTGYELAEEALGFSRKSGDYLLECTNLVNLGITAFQLGRNDEALGHFRNSLSIAHGYDNSALIACSIDGIAAVSSANGDHKIGARLAGAADRIRENIGYVLEMTERDFRDGYIAEIRKMVGDGVFELEFANGAATMVKGRPGELMSQKKGKQLEMLEIYEEIIIEETSVTQILVEE